MQTSQLDRNKPSDDDKQITAEWAKEAKRHFKSAQSRAVKNIKCGCGGRKKNNEASVSGHCVNSGSLSLCVHCMTEKAEQWQVWSRSWTVWLMNKYLSLKVWKKSKLWSSMNIAETRSNLKHSRVKKRSNNLNCAACWVSLPSILSCVLLPCSWSTFPQWSCA